MTKRKAAFLFASQTLGKQKLFLWHFTFREVLAVKETRKHWNHFLTILQREWPNLQGLRVFELHEEHGLHVHLITNRFIEVNGRESCRRKLDGGGFMSRECRVNMPVTWRSIYRWNGRNACIDGAFARALGMVGN
jgi:hypothetical protein